MNSWESRIKELIEQYHFIFKSNGDMRLSCSADKESIHCYGLDEIEMCVYCVMQSAGFESDLKWEIKESGGKYFFSPVASDDFKEALQNISTIYPQCTVKGKNLYFEHGKLTALYKVCEGEFYDYGRVKSCNIVVDMILNLNQSDRTKEDLDNFCALFCCYNINFLHALLLEISHYIKHKDKMTCLKILKEIVDFMERVFAFRKYITDHPEEKAQYMESLKRTSVCLANLFRQRAQSDPLPLNQYRNVSYDSKLKEKFPSTKRRWNYKADVGSEESCQKIFRRIANFCTDGQVDFKGSKDDDDIRTVKAFLNTGDIKT